MAFEVQLNAQAERDFEEIAAWYVELSPVAYENFLKRLYERLEELQDYPDRFASIRSRPQYRKVTLRRYPYYVVYRINVQRNRVAVARIVHTSRDHANWLKTLR